MQKHIVGSAVVVFALAALSGILARSALAATTPPPVPSSTAYFGARVKPTSGQTQITAPSDFERVIGRKLAIDHYYLDYGSTIPSNTMIASAQNGRYPLVDLDIENVPWARIAAGADDSYLASAATNIASWGQRCFLNFEHEPDSTSGMGGPADFVAAWRHVVQVFRQAGASNCSWVWIIKGETFGSTSAASSWYPGDSYVDWLGADAYNWYPGQSGSQWRSFATVFAAFQAWAVTYHGSKPAMVAETGVQEDPANSSRKAQWLLDALSTMKSWPQFKALVYFESNTIYPWWVTTSTPALTAYKTIGADPYFSYFGS